MPLSTFLDRLLHRLASGGAPEGRAPLPSVSEAGSRKDPASSLDRFETEFRQLFSGSSSACLAEGHLFMISLAPISRALGAQWSVARANAHAVVVSVLRERLTGADVFVAYDDVTYLLAFSQIGMESATIRALALGQMVSRQLVGETKSPAEVFRAIRGKGDQISLEPVHAPKLVTAGSGGGVGGRALPGPMPGAPRYDLPNGIGFVFRPLLTARTMVLSTYHCIPVAPRKDGSFRSGYDLAATDAAIAELDHAVLYRVADELRHRRDGQGLLSLPVHHETLATPSRRSAYAHLCASLVGQSGAERLVFELAGLPEGVAQSHLIDVVATLRPYSKAVLARFPPETQSFHGVRAAGVHAVGMDVHSAAEDEAALFAKLDTFAAAAASEGVKCYCHGIRTLSLYTASIAAGMDYVDGYAITGAVPSPRKALRYPLNTPFRLKFTKR